MLPESRGRQPERQDNTEKGLAHVWARLGILRLVFVCKPQVDGKDTAFLFPLFRGEFLHIQHMAKVSFKFGGCLSGKPARTGSPLS
jgi:hypothetical protein